MHQQDTVLAVGLSEAARRLSLSTRTVANLISRGELVSRLVGRRRLIAVSELEAFIKRDHRAKSVKPSNSDCRSKRGRGL
jgi:excisionase family DNA binding protein